MTASSTFTSADARGSRRAVGDSFPEGPPGCVQGTRKEEGRDLDKGASNADVCLGFYKRSPSVLGSGGDRGREGGEGCRGKRGFALPLETWL